MKKLCVIILLSFKLISVCGQERYYFDISEGTDALHEIDLYNTINHSEGNLDFEIESFTLLRSRKAWRINRIRKTEMTDDFIYVTDISNRNLFIYDLQGEAKNKIDITNYDEKAWITDYTVYNDTIYIVDKKSLLLFKFNKHGNFLSRDLLTFNFDDFTVNREGFFFICKHEKASKGNTIRINVFDRSLMLLKQYFVSSQKNKYYFKPEFFLTEDEDEILFSIAQNNEMYKIVNDSVFRYLKIKNAKIIHSLSHAHGLHAFQASKKNIKNGELLWTCYFKKGVMEAIRFDTIRSDDLSIFLYDGLDNGIYQDSYLSVLDFNTRPFLRSIPDMDWSYASSKIKRKFFNIIEQINERQRHVVIRYKIIDNTSLED
ncbi:6-bladed beta-propeller [Marinilabilia rubra]|uniref:6-bladed beta-propeller n=1 Tax=Marinilabilia rubra TaxID=2162893 RepID=A0A2U2B7J8_9BACT|nr:6-bladed beta-propeller [Marinilabilia rubra]PWD99022.1 hypothetical protein DDZ16_12210 [Marinilabilia rubra]